jgi:hypothetical protein
VWISPDQNKQRQKLSYESRVVGHGRPVTIGAMYRVLVNTDDTEAAMKRPYDSQRYDWTCPKCGMPYRILPGSGLDTATKGWHRCPQQP